MNTLLAGSNLPFTAALVLMLLVGAVQALGLGGEADANLGADLDADGGPSALLDWLNFGRLPLLMLLVVLLFTFGASGLALQAMWRAAADAPLPLWAAVPAAGLASLPLTRRLGRMLARWLPGDETTAVTRDSLVGRVALVVAGTAVPGSPAQVRVRDEHGQRHYVMLEPEAPADRLAEGERVLITRRDGATFYGIRNDEPVLDKVSV